MNNSVDCNCLDERVAYRLNLLVTGSERVVLPLSRQQLEQGLAEITGILFGN